MSSSHPAPQETPPLYVVGISISLARGSGKTVGPLELKTKNKGSLKDVSRTMNAGERHLEEFDPPLFLALDDHIFVSAKCSSKYRKLSDLVIDINLRDVACFREEHGIRSYRKKDRNVEVEITGGCNYQPPLTATTTELTQYCSKFRLLIMGNSGVGKSSLIRKVFGVKEVNVSQSTRGDAKIDEELISPTNGRFIVHDSLGFEAGDVRNMELVKEFVDKRKAKPLLKDKLHAVWLCLEIPYSRGRLLEAGVENFLKQRSEILGKVPLIVVLTKIDRLDLQLELDLPDDEKPDNFRSKYMKEYIFDPLYTAAGKDVAHVTVSTEGGYSESLSNLTEATDEMMKKCNVEEAARVAAIIAQRVSIKEKIDESIAIGKKKYWNMLFKSAVFRGHTLKDCLQVIRNDIITIWNVNDQDQRLMDDQIIDILLRTDNLGDVPDEDAPSTLAASFGDLVQSGFELAKDLASVHVTLAALAPVASILFSVGKMTYSAFQQATNDVKILMAYIVDLICVMQVIFLLGPDCSMTEESVVLVLRVYEKSRRFVHLQVDAFDGKLGVRPGGCDTVLDKIEDLIWRYSIPDHDVGALRKKIVGATRARPFATPVI